MPATSWLATEDASRPGYTAAFGDPSLAIGYSLRAGDWRLGCSASYQYPLGIWSYYEIAERHIASGSGYPTLGLDFSATRYLDPLVAGMRFTARTGLERRGQFGKSSRPLLLNLGFSAVEALNEVVSLSVSLSSEVDSPRLVDGHMENGGWQYSMSSSAFLVFLGETFSFRIGLAKTLSDISALPRLEASASYSFRIKG